MTTLTPNKRNPPSCDKKFGNDHSSMVISYMSAAKKQILEGSDDEEPCDKI